MECADGATANDTVARVTIRVGRAAPRNRHGRWQANNPMRARTRSLMLRSRWLTRSPPQTEFGRFRRLQTNEEGSKSMHKPV